MVSLSHRIAFHLSPVRLKPRISESASQYSLADSDGHSANDSLDALLTGRWSLNQFMNAVLQAHVEVLRETARDNTEFNTVDTDGDISDSPAADTTTDTPVDSKISAAAMVTTSGSVLTPAVDTPMIVLHTELVHDGYLYQVSHTIKQLFVDGLMYVGTDVLETPDQINASRLNSPQHWFEWRLQSETEQYQFREPGQNEWTALAGTLIDSTGNEPELHGSYSSTTAGGNPMMGLVSTNRREFSFLPDNRFEVSLSALTSSGGWTDAVSTHTAKNESATELQHVSLSSTEELATWTGSSEESNGKLQGYYQIQGNYIELTMDNGQSFKQLFLRVDDSIFLDSQQYRQR